MIKLKKIHIRKGKKKKKKSTITMNNIMRGGIKLF
jgi:hypothetical protein